MIIIPTFNSGKFIAKTLDSVKNQTMECQIIVLDNRSEDNTQEIVGRYEGVELIVNDENVGRIGNWNRAIEVAAERVAPFFKILFAGDVIKPDAMKRYKELFDTYPEIALITSAYEIKDSGDIVAVNRELGSSQEISRMEGLKINLTTGSWYASPSIQAYRTSLVKDIRFKATLPWASDWQFCIDISKQYPAYFIDEVLAEFHMDSRRYYFSNIKKVSSVAEDFYVAAGVLEYLKDKIDSKEYSEYEEIIRQRYAKKLLTSGNILKVILRKIKNVFIRR